MLQSFLVSLKELTPLAVVIAAIYLIHNILPLPFARDDTHKRVRYLPSRIPILGNAIELLSNSKRMNEWISEKLIPLDGEPFILRLPGKSDMMFLAKPEHFEEVLKTQFENFPKSAHIHDVFFDLLGNGVVLTNGQTWKRQRKVLVSLFSARAVREIMTPISLKYAIQLRTILNTAAAKETPLDVFGLMHRYTLDVFSEIGFGTELKLLDGYHDEFAKAIEESQYIVSARFKQPDTLWKIKRWLNIGSEKKLRHAIHIIDEFVMQIISSALDRHQKNRDAKEENKLKKGIVSSILDSIESSTDDVNLNEVRDIAVAALIASRDTTADALGWLFHVLSENPKVETKLRSELRKYVPQLAKDAAYIPTVDELNAVRYLEATIRELLRLYPPGPVIATHCIRDTVFTDGTFVPKNTDIGLAFFSTGRLESVWGQDALEFKPERFLDATGELVSMSSSKFCAFSAGPRICIGRNLALLEMKIVLAIVIGCFHFVPESGQPKPAFSQGITLGMQTPLLMRVESA